MTDPGCAMIVNCQAACYNGIGLDGGTFDANPDDAGANTAADQCAAMCLLLDAGVAGMSEFLNYDNCNSTVCGTPCACP
jgi:hypothetical protein